MPSGRWHAGRKLQTATQVGMHHCGRSSKDSMPSDQDWRMRPGRLRAAASAARPVASMPAAICWHTGCNAVARASVPCKAANFSCTRWACSSGRCWSCSRLAWPFCDDAYDPTLDGTAMLSLTIFLPLLTGLIVLMLPASRPALVRQVAHAGAVGTQGQGQALWGGIETSN